MKIGNIYVGPDFLLLLFLGFLWLEWEVVVSVLSAWLLHEGAHLILMYLLGGRSRLLYLSLMGARIVTQQGEMGYGRELFCVLAGPGANLLASFLLAYLGEAWYICSGVNLMLGVFNLLPLPGLDGGRVIKLLILLLTKRGEK